MKKLYKPKFKRSLIVLTFLWSSLYGQAINAGMPDSIKQIGVRQDLFFKDLTSFPKWTDMFVRANLTQKNVLGNCKTNLCNKITATLHTARTQDPRQQVETINAIVNEAQYKNDQDVWKKADYWASPEEFLTYGGDCEDFAITKYLLLRALGIHKTAMRITLVHDKEKALDHAVLVVKLKGQELILDNQNKTVRPFQYVNGYSPIYSLSEHGWWLHVGI